MDCRRGQTVPSFPREGQQVPETFWEPFDDPARLESLERKYLLELGRYCMKMPFFNYDASERYLREATGGPEALSDA